MAENLTRQILSEHLVDGELKPGEPISLRIDQTLLQDATGTMATMQFEQLEVPRVKARDIILELLRRLSASGGKNKVFEFTGPGTAGLSVPERGTIANMIAELGATSAVFPPDESTREWLRLQERDDDFKALSPEDGAEYDDRVEIDLDALGPLVAKPQSPGNVVPVEEVAGTSLAQVCIGSSVNSGYADLALPGAVLEGKIV